MKDEVHAVTRRAVLGGALAVPALVRSARADQTVTLISHRYPALEYYADKMKGAVPGVQIDARLMPSGDAMQLQRLAFSSHADSMDLLWANGVLTMNYAKNGWIQPLDDLFEKYRAEFRLDDIAPASLRGVTYKGRIYALPLTTNTLLYAYRGDIFQERKLQPAKTWEAYVELAKTLNSPRRNAVSISLKWDMPPYELQSVLNTIGSGWFDQNWRPTFNSDRGVVAIELYKRLSQYAVSGFTAQGNDENTVNFGQDLCAMGQQWATRAAAMDNPQKSHVVGKMEWTVPPGGHQGLSTDGYAISSYSTKDRDLLFRILATALNEANQHGAADLATPTRKAVLNDPEIQAKYRWYPAISQCLEVGQPLPDLPEFTEAAEVATKRMVQAIVGQMPVKEALDTGASEVQDLLKRRGYYD